MKNVTIAIEELTESLKSFRENRSQENHFQLLLDTSQVLDEYFYLITFTKRGKVIPSTVTPIVSSSMIEVLQTLADVYPKTN